MILPPEDSCSAGSGTLFGEQCYDEISVGYCDSKPVFCGSPVAFPMQKGNSWRRGCMIEEEAKVQAGGHV